MALLNFLEELECLHVVRKDYSSPRCLANAGPAGVHGKILTNEHRGPSRGSLLLEEDEDDNWQQP